MPTLPVLLAYVRACGGDEADWERRWREATADAAEEAEAREEVATSPYKGLARFEPEDRDTYFGRGELVTELAASVIRHRVVALVGGSGSGKSSLLRAGLVPALRDEQDPRRRPALVRVITPSEHPDPALLEPVAAEEGDTIVLIDQFEELFTLCQDNSARARFVEALIAARAPESRLRVVIAVRADFYGRCADYGPLADALRSATLLVGPMTSAQLRDAVIGPAQRDRLLVEKTLTARIVADVERQPGGLPLMAHALLEVWRRRRGKTLTEQAYDAIGGMRGAIAHTAEAVYARFTDEQAAVARRLLLRMVSPGDGTQDTRRPVDRTELPPAVAESAVLEELVRARLLTVDGTTVDLAHEALLTGWPRLRGWIETDRERLRLHRALTEAARAWEALDRDPGALYRGVRLSAAREAFGDRNDGARGDSGASDELTALEAEFHHASVAAHEQALRTRARGAHRRRSLLAALALLVCLAAVAGTTAWQQSRVSDRRHDEAEARRVAGVAIALRTSDPRLAMRLSMASWRIADLPETREAVRGAASQRELSSFTPRDGTGDLQSPGRLSADGRILTKIGRDRVYRWDSRTGRSLGATRIPGDAFASVLAISRDAGRVAYLDGAGALVVRDLHDGGLSRRLGLLQGGYPEAEFGPGGRLLLTEDVDKEGSGSRVQVWDVETGRLVFAAGARQGDGPMAQLSPDGKLLAACAYGGARLSVWDLQSKRRIPAPWTREADRELCDQGAWFTFLPDNRALAVGVEGGVRTWDVRDGRERPRIRTGGEDRPEASFSADGAYAVTAQSDIALWQLARPDRPLTTYTPEGPYVVEPRVDPVDGVLRFAVGGTSTVKTLDVRATLEATTSGPQDQQDYQQAEFSADGNTAVTTRRDGQDWEFWLHERDGRTSSLPGRARGDPAPHVAFSPDGRTIAYGVSEVRLWNVAHRRETARIKVPEPVETIAVDADATSLRFATSRPMGGQNDAPRVVEVWRASEQARKRLLRTRTETHSVFLTPDATTLFASNGDQYDLGTGRRVTGLHGQDTLQAVRFSQDRKHLAVSARDGRVTLWDGLGRHRIAVLAQSDHAVRNEPLPVAFSADGEFVAVGAQDGSVRIWETGSPGTPGTLIQAGEGQILGLGFTDDTDHLRIATRYGAHREVGILDPQQATRQVCERARGGLGAEQWDAYLPELSYRETC
ncbi:WD40 repeat domain-containing protein [Streptomyces cyaneofuscatus]|uniref:WD40 repeat domain-containing protein n=1 Tax=Streptomyces cyaneofuscatus TaxID=66883 RepID=UPI002D76633F|nr:WD40 repeat domain-containing protein [Streptomyces cyaneofuscatus]WRO08126.1 WD40 repeat domain-containing protein [Streptomyces cyaneofuscatus]